MNNRSAHFLIAVVALFLFAVAWLFAFFLLRWLLPLYLLLSLAGFFSAVRRPARRSRRDVLDSLAKGALTPAQAARELKRCRS